MVEYPKKCVAVKDAHTVVLCDIHNYQAEKCQRCEDTRICSVHMDAAIRCAVEAPVF